MEIDVTLIRKYCCAVDWRQVDPLWKALSALIELMVENDITLLCDFQQPPVKYSLKRRPGGTHWKPLNFHETT